MSAMDEPPKDGVAFVGDAVGCWMGKAAGADCRSTTAAAGCCHAGCCCIVGAAVMASRAVSDVPLEQNVHVEHLQYLQWLLLFSGLQNSAHVL